jgi:hypothetical protein
MSNNNVKLKRLLILLSFLNVFDGLSTLFFLNHGCADESNPLMHWAFSQSVEFFLILKVIIVGFCILVIWLGSKYSKYIKALNVIVRVLVLSFVVLFLYESFFFVKAVVFLHKTCNIDTCISKG